MEWIIGLIVIYLIWRIFFAKRNEAALIQQEIVDIYTHRKGETVYSDFNYLNYRDYAKDKGSDESIWNDGGRGISVIHKMLTGEKVLVTITKNRRTGKANIAVENFEEISKKTLDELGV